jgi:hypothetical protein
MKIVPNSGATFSFQVFVTVYVSFPGNDTANLCGGVEELKLRTQVFCFHRFRLTSRAYEAYDSSMPRLTSDNLSFTNDRL